MDAFFYVGIGGFLGANARYYIATMLTNRFLHLTGLSLPVGTLIVNITGSFLLAIFSVWLTSRLGINPHLRLLIGTGFFGAYTTFSTFANETVSLAVNQNLSIAIAYFVLTNVTCILGVVFGLFVAQRLFSI